MKYVSFESVNLRYSEDGNRVRRSVILWDPGIPRSFSSPVVGRELTVLA